MSVISDATAAYQTLRTANSAVSAAQIAITNLGGIPQFGDILVSDPDYDNVVAARGTWTSTIAGLRVTLANAVSAKNAALIAFYATGIWPNQWVEFTGLTGTPAAAVYVGFAYNSQIMQPIDIALPIPIELTSAPLNNFPDQTV